jgi:hypothetical protein
MVLVVIRNWSRLTTAHPTTFESKITARLLQQAGIGGEIDLADSLAGN